MSLLTPDGTVWFGGEVSDYSEKANPTILSNHWYFWKSDFLLHRSFFLILTS